MNRRVRVLLAILVAVGLVGGGFYAGQQSAKSTLPSLVEAALNEYCSPKQVQEAIKAQPIIPSHPVYQLPKPDKKLIKT